MDLQPNLETKRNNRPHWSHTNTSDLRKFSVCSFPVLDKDEKAKMVLHNCFKQWFAISAQSPDLIIFHIARGRLVFPNKLLFVNLCSV